MSAVTGAQAVKTLREVTGLGMMECKKILDEAGNDLEKAKEIAAKRGQYRAAKVSERVASEGTIGYYVHHDKKTAAIVELNCNTDFVARSPDFQTLARELALQVTGYPPQVVNKEELDPAAVAKAEKEFRLEVAAEPEDKAKDMFDKKMKAWFTQAVLMDQPYVKDPSKSVRQLIEEVIGTTKENIRVARFARFRVGETAKKEEPVKNEGAAG